MTDKMKKILRNTGWLVMAAALTMGMTACSSEDSMTDEQPELKPTQAVGKVHVSVGAGIDSNTTRSAVVTENGTRKLTFTAGDRLYIYGYLSDEGGGKSDMARKATTRGDGGSKTLAGYLDIDGTPEAGATTATFSGDLTVWGSGEEPWVYDVESSYDFTTGDPLGECSTVRAILVHKDAGSSFVVRPDKSGNYENGNLAATVDVLMTTSFNIEGTYDSENKSFTLAIDDKYGSTPIFNCTVTSGLTANAVYEVTLLAGENASSVGENGLLGTVTANSSGGVSFACTSKVSEESRYYAIRFKNTAVSDDWKRISLGTKALKSKVYNISRAASADPDAPAIPTITGATYTTPNENGDSWIDGNGGALTFSIEGISRGVGFTMSNCTSATVTLINLDAKSQNCFLFGNTNITIVLDGNSTITAQDAGACISAGTIFAGPNAGNGGYLKLKTTGSTQTLTVTVGNDPYCGLDGYYNYSTETSTNNNETTAEVDVTEQLAAPGFTVTRSARSESGGKYTWTYTIAPAPAYYAATNYDIGKVIGSDGNIYASKTAAEAVNGVAAVAMIAYVGTASNCAHGLAIALENVGNGNTWDSAAGLCNAWNTSKTVTGGTWRLPSIVDWQYMFVGCGTDGPVNENPTAGSYSMSYSGLASKLETAGGEGAALPSSLWSKDGGDTNHWYISFDSNSKSATFRISTYSSGTCPVRACLAF